MNAATERLVLVVENHEESRKGLTDLLQGHGYRVVEAANGRAALAVARRAPPAVVVLDLSLPDMEGLDALRAFLELHPRPVIVVVSGSGTIEVAVAAMKAGAVDFFTKPIRAEGILDTLERTRGVVRSPASGVDAEPAPVERFGLLNRSRAMRELLATVQRVAPHLSTVLLLGESGAGKELVARTLHGLSHRAAGPFVAVSCGRLSEPVLESELFGHERAFSSAGAVTLGAVEIADGGTLLLDEVDEMGLSCQAKLLRALERREFRRVGGTRKVKVDLSVIATSSVDLPALVKSGGFRADLYYRLQVVTLVVPPLRERTEAIPDLVRRFLEESGRAARLREPKRLSDQAMAALVRYPWPGNVRELKNLAESLTLLVPGAVVEVADLPAQVRETISDEIRFRVGTSMADVEREVIRRTLDASPTVKDAARTLGIALRTLYTKIRRHELDRRPGAPARPYLRARTGQASG